VWGFGCHQSLLVRISLWPPEVFTANGTNDPHWTLCGHDKWQSKLGKVLLSLFIRTIFLHSAFKWISSKVKSAVFVCALCVSTSFCGKWLNILVVTKHPKYTYFGRQMERVNFLFLTRDSISITLYYFICDKLQNMNDFNYFLWLAFFLFLSFHS